MALIFFKDYADVKSSSDTKRLLVPTSVVGRLSLLQQMYSNFFPKDEIQSFETTYTLSGTSLPYKKWGLDQNDTILVGVPKVPVASSAITSDPNPIPSAEVDKRGKFLGFATSSLKSLMTQYIHTYEDFVVELDLTVGTKNDNDDIDTAEFLYKSAQQTLSITIEFNRLSKQALQNLKALIVDTFNQDYDAIDFFDDIGLSGIEGQQILLEWVDSLIDFVK
jgi:hypothetical protein